MWAEYDIDYLNFIDIRDHIVKKLQFGKFAKMYVLEPSKELEIGLLVVNAMSINNAIRKCLELVVQ